ncbi:hypothetical protein [Aequorivita sinensis]|uniref:hypothetical protein n=1 Tax=Aequorivita sinensis TaxID=1382458 RepID=UPI00111F9130|nr:hypothetical protein [Aequorivita sinensis]
MKVFIYILMALSFALIIFNATKLEFDNILVGDSSVAVFGILAGMCSFILLGILLISKKIASKVKK